MDISTNRVLVSRHVVFDETSFPFAASSVAPTSSDFNFLDEPDCALPPVGTRVFAGDAPCPACPAAPDGHAPRVVASGAGPASRTAAPAGLVPQAAASSARPATATSSPGSPPAASVGAWPGHVGSTSPPWTVAPAGSLPRVAPRIGSGHASLPSNVTSTPSPVATSAGHLPQVATSASHGSVPSFLVPCDPVDAATTSATASTAPVPHGAVHVAPVANDHVMVTRGKSGFRQPRQLLNLQAAALSPLPKTYRGALNDPNWRLAMHEEFTALQANNTWVLVPCPPGANVVSGKWVFCHKLNPDGSLDRYKARWVLRGFTQRPGIDFGETFSPVVKPATIRTVLTVALSQDWPIHQLDVKNAFLHGTLTETVYCVQPAGFVDPTRPCDVCRLNKSLHGLKQAPRAWYDRFATHLLSLGFHGAKSDTSLFVYRRGSATVYLLLYVDDIILTASSASLLHQVISAL